MKIALSSSGKDINSNLSGVFGRCPFFLIVEIQNKKIRKIEAWENSSVNQLGGAGISAAQAVAEKGVEAVITENIGPRATSVFRQFNIQVYKGAGSAKEVLQNFIDGKLKKIQ